MYSQRTYTQASHSKEKLRNFIHNIYKPLEAVTLTFLKITILQLDYAGGDEFRKITPY